MLLALSQLSRRATGFLHGCGKDALLNDYLPMDGRRTLLKMLCRDPIDVLVTPFVTMSLIILSQS